MSENTVAAKKQKLNDGSAVTTQVIDLDASSGAIEVPEPSGGIRISSEFLVNNKELVLDVGLNLESLVEDVRRKIISNMDIFTATKLTMTNKFWQTNTKITEVDLRKQALKIDDEVVEGLFHLFPSLQKINFKSCYKVTGDSLSLLPSLTNLKSLNLSETGLKGNAFETIPNCTNLEELILVRCPTTPALIKAICEKVTGLKKLNLFWPPLTQSISDASLQLMNGLVNLTYLNVSWSEEITDKGIMSLGALTNLEVLKINSAKITDKSLEFIGKTFKKLRTLHIQETLITNEGIRDQLVPNMQQLTSIALGGKNVTDPALGHIVGLKNLKTVITGGPGVTDSGVLSIAKIAGLQYVNIWQSSITDEAMTYLASLMQLKKLKLDGNIYITDDGIERIASLRKLRLLSLFGCSLVTDRGPRYISNDNLNIIR